MRFPLKLNKAGWPAYVGRLLRASEDPRVLLDDSLDSDAFSRAVSVLKFGATFKTTCGGRFPCTIAKLASLEFAKPPVVLDVGASDGSTSLDVMQSLTFGKYYCTDLNIECRVAKRGEWTYFFSYDGTPVVAASESWVAYNDAAGSTPLFGRAASAIFRRAPLLSDARRIELVNPALRNRMGERVLVQRHSALDRWGGEPCDLIIAANILNRTYFDDQQLTRIVENLGSALRPEGWLALIDNRDTERSSMISVTPKGVRVHARIGAGSEVESLAMRVLQRAKLPA